jgi:hypothetical protein
MYPFRDGISAPGLRDNDWAHTPYDDMRFAAAGRGIGNREPGSSLRSVDDELDDARTYDDAAARTSAATTTTLVSADALAGDVRNQAGELLGKVDAIMIDVASGRVAYAVIASGGVLGVGEKLYPIPWQALRFDADERCLRIDLARERLRGAPGFERERWPALDDAQWTREVRAYYDAGAQAD